MPNGHVHYDAVDLVHWKFTEQAYPPLHVDRFDFSRGVRMLQLRGVRGYAPMPRMETWRYFEWPKRDAPRAEIDALASSAVEAVKALLVSNPDDHLDKAVRYADLAWLWFDGGWGFAVGFHVYMRDAPGEPLRRALPPLAELPDVPDDQREEVKKFLDRLLISIGVDGIAYTETRPSAFVLDLHTCSELLCTSTPLHAAACWDELAALPVHDTRATGLLVETMRAHGVERENDQVTLRWRRP